MGSRGHGARLVVWNFNDEGGSLTGRRFANQAAPMALCHDLIADRHAQTRTLAHGLGGKEGIEESLLNVWCDARPIV